jgi:hypothetical protein
LEVADGGYSESQATLRRERPSVSVVNLNVDVGPALTHGSHGRLPRAQDQSFSYYEIKIKLQMNMPSEKNLGREGPHNQSFSLI